MAQDLITKVFTYSPLAAAIASVLAAGVFYLLQWHWRTGKAATNGLIVLLLWAVAVPLFGFLESILAKIWEVIEFLASGAIKLVSSLYGIYSTHPLLMIGIIVVAGVGCLVWLGGFRSGVRQGTCALARS